MGGCPHLADDPRAECTRMLDVAEAHDLPVDLHVDEVTDLPESDDDLDIVELARQTLARGLTRPVTASHAVRLGMLPPTRLDPVLADVLRAGLGVVTLPITNLYLQGRDADLRRPARAHRGARAPRRGHPARRGRGQRARPVQRRGPRRPVRDDLAAADRGPPDRRAGPARGHHGRARRCSACPRAGVAPGDVADLILVPDVDLGDVLAGAETYARIVLSGGRVVADTRVQRRLEV